MGCPRPNLIEKPNVTIGTSIVEVLSVPPIVNEGQMTFQNRGDTNIALRFGQQSGSRDVSLIFFSVMLPAGKAFTEDGIVPGAVLALSDAAGGILDSYVSYR
jgi:hypothetical protein